MKKLLFLMIVVISTMTVESQKFINDYDNSAPEDGDKLVGTDISTTTVRNFTVASIATKIKGEVVDEATGITTVTVEIVRADTTPIEDVINALTAFTVDYNEQYMFECTVSSLTGTAGFEVYVLKLPKGTFGLAQTQLVADDLQQVNTSFINDRNVVLTRDYGYYSDWPTNLSFVPWMATTGETVRDALVNIAGEDGNPAAAYFVYVGDVNQTINGHKTFNDFTANLGSPDIEVDYSFLGTGSGGLNTSDPGLIIHGAPNPDVRVTWTKGALLGSSSIKPYDVIAGHTSLYFGEMTGGGAFADTMMLDAGNTVGGDGITVDWTQFDPEFTINVEAGSWITVGNIEYRLIAKDRVEVRVTGLIPDGGSETLPVGFRPLITSFKSTIDTGSGHGFAVIGTDGSIFFNTSSPAEQTRTGNVFTFPID